MLSFHFRRFVKNFAPEKMTGGQISRTCRRPRVFSLFFLKAAVIFLIGQNRRFVNRCTSLFVAFRRTLTAKSKQSPLVFKPPG